MFPPKKSLDVIFRVVFPESLNQSETLFQQTQTTSRKKKTLNRGCQGVEFIFLQKCNNNNNKNLHSLRTQPLPDRAGFEQRQLIQECWNFASKSKNLVGMNSLFIKCSRAEQHVRVEYGNLSDPKMLNFDFYYGK